MIRLLALDVDGVLTDGRLYYGPEGEALKVFHARDGIAFAMLAAAEIRTALISGHDSPAFRRRAAFLGVDQVRAPEHDKAAALVGIVDRLGVRLDDVAMIGDDLQDLRAMRMAGWSACPADAVREVRAEADYVSPLPGGAGAVRDIVEYLLRRAGRWTAAAAAYVPGG